ncbi:hypothetical protein GCM10023151_19020 [Kangiella marina]|uniref:Glycine zipper-like domain-containing protein n=2 Tax=Kangiella marina TaxID=1079178 RepID=A0ABP8IMU0_9GAMM
MCVDFLLQRSIIGSNNHELTVYTMNNKQPEGNHGTTYVGAYIAIGVGIGAALGVAMSNMMLGMGIGVAIGLIMGIGTEIKKRKSSNKDQ